ncbi:MAG: endonuclease III [Candidatus Aenigmatarchaeota archaeon]
MKEFRPPEMSWLPKDPYKILIACLLSLRTKDEVTNKAVKRLFELGDTPEKMVKLSEKEIQKAIYPVGFYRKKSKIIKKISIDLIKNYNSKVPDNMEDLLKLSGVGRKTANIVLTLGFNKPGIAVDTHVHRISNRLGLVSTKKPEETEFALKKVLPKKYWIEYNNLLVTFGQNICLPIKPKCSICKISSYCKKIGVKNHR